MLNIVRGKNRRRYIAFKIIGKKINFSELDETIKEKCRESLGKEPIEIYLQIIRFKNNYGIIRCKHTEKENIISLLRSIRKINETNVKIETIATSGTIRALVRKHMKEIF